MILRCGHGEFSVFSYRLPHMDSILDGQIQLPSNITLSKEGDRLVIHQGVVIPIGPILTAATRDTICVQLNSAVTNTVSRIKLEKFDL